MEKNVITMHVLSKDIAQTLWDKGVKVDSYFWWYKDPQTGNIFCTVKGYDSEYPYCELDKLYPTPMLSELLDLMPKHLEKKYAKDNASYSVGLVDNGWGKWECRYSDVFPIDGTVYLCKHSSTKAVDAVGKTLLWLIDNGYYKPV